MFVKFSSIKISGFNIQSKHLHLRFCAIFPFSLVRFSHSSRKVGIRNSSANAKQTAFQFAVWLFITFIYISHLLPRRWNCLHRYTLICVQFCHYDYLARVTNAVIYSIIPNNVLDFVFFFSRKLFPISFPIVVYWLQQKWNKAEKWTLFFWVIFLSQFDNT